MTKEPNARPVGMADKHHKGPWSTPTLTRIDAGDAEVFTNDGGDGTFTYS
jgi:hypothetical protein